MKTTSQNFVTVDMRENKAALLAHAHAHRCSISEVVRHAVGTVVLAPDSTAPLAVTASVKEHDPSHLAKVVFRLTMAELRRLESAAQSAGLSRSAFLADWIAGVPVVTSGGRREYIEAMIASNAEVSTLSRNLHHLTQLLREAESGAALEYVRLLETLDADIRQHLALAGQGLIQIRPKAHGVKGSNRIVTPR